MIITKQIIDRLKRRGRSYWFHPIEAGQVPFSNGHLLLIIPPGLIPGEIKSDPGIWIDGAFSLKDKAALPDPSTLYQDALNKADPARSPLSPRIHAGRKVILQDKANEVPEMMIFQEEGRKVAVHFDVRYITELEKIFPDGYDLLALKKGTSEVGVAPRILRDRRGGNLVGLIMPCNLEEDLGAF